MTAYYRKILAAFSPREWLDWHARGNRIPKAYRPMVEGILADASTDWRKPYSPMRSARLSIQEYRDRSIRRLYRTGRYSMRELGRHYGISGWTVGRILERRAA